MRNIERIIKGFIETIFWVAIFLSPFLIGGIVFLILFLKNHTIFAYIILSLGVVIGVIFAEYIRKKYGCSTFMGSLLGTPDIWPNEVDEVDEIDKRNSKDKHEAIPPHK